MNLLLLFLVFAIQELVDHLGVIMAPYPVEIIRGGGVSDGYIEVRPAGASKGEYSVLVVCICVRVYAILVFCSCFCACIFMVMFYRHALCCQ